MKKFTWVLGLTAVVCMASGARSFADYDHHDHDRDRDHDRDHDRGGAVVACSPDEANSNLKIADQTLVSISASKDFQDATTFNSKVSDIVAMPVGQPKMDAYFKLLGVKDPTDSAEILNLLYARQIPDSYLNSATDNLQINKAQATVVFNQLTTALRPR